MDIRDPIITDPPDDTAQSGWQECGTWVATHGMLNEDGAPNMLAAAGADPGCTTCPNCAAQYWAFGRRQRCRDCGFEYPTNWWPMYAYGVRDGRAAIRPNPVRMKSPYYRYGYEHPVADAWAAHQALPWLEIATP